MCIQRCSPTLNLGATFWHLLITIPSLWREQGRMIFPRFSHCFSPSDLLQQLENSEFPLDVKENTLLMLCALCIFNMAWTRFRVSTVNSMFRFRTETSRKVIQRSALRKNSDENRHDKLAFEALFSPMVWK